MKKQEITVFDFQDGRGPVAAHQHSNGNGWVENNCEVSSTSFISADSMVQNHSKVRNSVLTASWVNNSEVVDSRLSEYSRVDNSVIKSSLINDLSKAVDSLVDSSKILQFSKIVNSRIIKSSIFMTGVEDSVVEKDKLLDERPTSRRWKKAGGRTIYKIEPEVK